MESVLTCLRFNVCILPDTCVECILICVCVFSFAYALNTGLLEVIVPSPDYYPNFDTLQDTFGDTMERVRQDVSGITIIESKIVIPIILNNHIESNWRC